MLGAARVSIGLAEAIGPLETNEDWQSALLLPEDYEVVGVKCIPDAGLYELTISSDAIPEDGLSILLHHRMENGQAFFDHISLKKWDGEQWLNVEVAK